VLFSRKLSAPALVRIIYSNCGVIFEGEMPKTPDNGDTYTTTRDMGGVYTGKLRHRRTVKDDAQAGAPAVHEYELLLYDTEDRYAREGRMVTGFGRLKSIAGREAERLETEQQVREEAKAEANRRAHVPVGLLPPPNVLRVVVQGTHFGTVAVCLIPGYPGPMTVAEYTTLSEIIQRYTEAPRPPKILSWQVLVDESVTEFRYD